MASSIEHTSPEWWQWWGSESDWSAMDLSALSYTDLFSYGGLIFGTLTTPDDLPPAVLF